MNKKKPLTGEKLTAAEAAFPLEIKPMLATLVAKPFDDPNWMYEIKWDGYRALTFIDNGRVNIASRNNKSFNDKYYPLYKTLTELKARIILDGEIVVLSDKGLADFSRLQNWRSEADGQLVYYVFDILWLNDDNLMDRPLKERREILEQTLPVSDQVRLSQIFEASGTEFFKAAERMALEGIMAKKADSIYVPDLRSKAWLKIKTEQRQEAVICGYTNNENGRKSFSALLMGVYKDGQLNYIGPVGTGFSNQHQQEILEKLKPLITSQCPFQTVPDFNKPSRFRPNPPKATVTWVRPELVGEVSYREITKDGVMRHPSFKGLREDKKATEVVLEKPGSTEELLSEHDDRVKKKLIAAPADKTRKSFLNPKDESQVRNVCGETIKFNNLSKLYWPEDNVSKRDMLNYYYQVAEYILPYLKDRPQSLNRFPNGIHGTHFYQKDVKDKSPDREKTFPYITSDGEKKEFLVPTDEASLLWMASLGCIEMNPWFSRTKNPDNPDYCVIDLDPDKNTFEQVIEAALVTKKVLDAIDVPSYVKTSGSTGIHIYIPLEAKYTYDQSQMFGRILATIIHKEMPDVTSIERQIKNRQGKMYVDFLQNRPGATLASPYSLRPKPGAPVSMPLHWEEVKPGLSMKNFNIFNAADRVKTEGNFFGPVLDKGIDLEAAVQKAKSIFGT